MSDNFVSCPHCGRQHITGRTLAELIYIQREAPKRGGYIYEGARQAYEEGKYWDQSLAELLSCGAIVPNQDQAKGWTPAKPRSGRG